MQALLNCSNAAHISSDQGQGQGHTPAYRVTPSVASATIISIRKPPGSWSVVAAGVSAKVPVSRSKPTMLLLTAMYA
jgi:hypothetical protein